MNGLSFPRGVVFSVLILLAGAGWIWASRAAPGSTSSGETPAPRAGFLAPAFTLQTLSGEEIALSALRGRPVLVNVWASWCSPCKAEMPAMQKVYEEYQSQGFTILGVNATNQDNASLAAAFVQRMGITFPILLDTDGSVSRLYDTRALPTSFFIDRQGVIREVVIGGPMSEALLRIRVAQLFEEQAGALELQSRSWLTPAAMLQTAVLKEDAR